MNNPGLPNSLWKYLDGRLWHATSVAGLTGMLEQGEIQVSNGPRYQNSLSRSESAISLFDFGPSARDEWDQLRNWRQWFGHHQNSRVAIWLEIDRSKTSENLFDAGAAHAKSQTALQNTFIPGVEAFHIGPIPLRCVCGALLVARDDLSLIKWHEGLSGIEGTVARFEQILPPSPPEHPLALAIKRARSRSSHSSQDDTA